MSKPKGFLSAFAAALAAATAILIVGVGGCFNWSGARMIHGG